ncbi:MAG: hypothetical protein LBK12_04085 [Odoribacteraceae bacterium]|nr:hypothetical protein [Odoribacteraceae bacterium]
MKQVNKTFLLAALVMFAGACVVNMDDEREPVVGADGCVVTLSIAVSGPAGSRAMSPETEGAVSDVDVLLFDKMTDEFRYWAIGSNVTPNATFPERITSFSVKLPSETWTVVVLANARELLEASAHADVKAAVLAGSSTLSRKALLESLVMTIGTNTPWGNAKVFPMWGYYRKGTSTTLTVDENTATIADAINLTRAVVRVDISVGVDEDDPVRDVFSLESARLYNRNRAGSIAPAASTALGNADGYDPSQWNGSKAIEPNVPTSPLLEPGPIVYNINSIPTTPVYLYEREIYTFEAEAGATNKSCLVIGGYYDNCVVYYRVDFAKSNGSYLSLLRNHSYHVKIKEVLAAGYASVTEAFDNKPSNIVVEITEDDGAIGHIVFDEQNYLGASTGEIIIPGNAQTGKRVTVSTDVAGGWIITGTFATSEPHEGFDVNWLTAIDPLTGVNGNVTFNASENDSGAKRIGYIHVLAGRLHLAVKVTQLATGIWITDTVNTEIQELIFESTGGVQPAARQFLLHWVPAGAQVNSMSIPASGYPVFAYDPSHHMPGEGAMIGISDPSGQMTIDIRPTALTPGEIATNPFIEKASLIRFVAFYNGDFASTDIELRYVNHHTAVDVDAIYKPDGDIHSFTVRSNTEWYISSVSDPQNILQATPVLLNLSGGYNTTGETVNFRLINGAVSTSGEVTLTLTDPTGRMGDVSVIIKGAACGTEGNAVSIRIGNNDYLTHMYDTKCWMVQNSKEGSSSATRYNNNSAQVNGYYYTYSQASVNNACPNGWRLPTYDEIDVVITAAINDEYGIGRWWWGNDGINNDAFAGYYFNGLPSPEWRNWNASGSWWVVGNNAYLYGLQGSLAKYTGGVGYNSVRCVHD